MELGFVKERLDCGAEGSSECFSQSRHPEAQSFYITGIPGKFDSRSDFQEESLHDHGGLVGPAAVNGCLRYTRFCRNGFNGDCAKTVLQEVLEGGLYDHSFNFFRT